MTTLHDSATFKLVSYGNGLSYSLTHKPSDKSVCVHGDDALQFEYEIAAIERQFPAYTYDQVYAWLWDQCDYGSAAS